MSDDFVPGPHSTASLMWHILKKSWQSGSVIGLGVVVPIAAFRAHRKGNSLDSQKLLTLLGYSGAAGMGVLGAAGAVRCMILDTEGTEDRVYRLHYNEGQNRTDLFSAGGGTLGAIIAGSAIHQHPWVIAGGFAAGTCAGILCHCLSKKSEEEEKAPKT